MSKPVSEKNIKPMAEDKTDIKILKDQVRACWKKNKEKVFVNLVFKNCG